MTPERTDFATLDDVEFRRVLADFFATQTHGPAPRDSEGRLAWQRSWCATLADHGFAGPSWPASVGGMELPFPKQVIYSEERARHRVPGQPGTGVLIAGPTIIRHGTDEQRERWLRPLLRADVIWAQAFSEPDAGSDLSSLRTTARREGDTYVVNGAKVWSSWAEIADSVFTLVRTGAPNSGSAGVSYLVIDTTTPGVEIRPLRDMSGRSDFCEIRFDDVVVPVSERIGPENEGWPLVRTSLGHERSAGALNQARHYQRVLTELIELAGRMGRSSDAVLRQSLAELHSKVRIMDLAARSTIAVISTRGEPGPLSSVSRLMNAQVEQQLHELAVDLLGGFGQLGSDDGHAIQHGRWTWGFLRTRASTIGAGTAEIQRNTIAEKVLGLPREPTLPGLGNHRTTHDSPAGEPSISRIRE